MNNKNIYRFFFLFLSIACTPAEQREQETTKTTNASSDRFDYVLDMVHDNPGEGRTVSKYTNPAYIKQIGIDGMIPHLHIQCAIDYATFDANLLSRCLRTQL